MDVDTKHENKQENGRNSTLLPAIAGHFTSKLKI